ncbi:MAG TPA: copper chaperone PCu(A)C [Stellaceae bacterium]|jgi:copper(I)-binding protein|nr:copper chaperone PCu(A)C [Stellaceae bacterium]
MLGRMVFRTFLFGLLAAVIAGSASAQSGNPPSVQAVNVWARATPQGAHTGAAYMTLVNPGPEDDRLIGATTPVAGEALIHSMSMENGVMMMRPVPGIDVKAGANSVLKPGGYHVMLMDLKQPLVQGKSFPLTLIFAKAGKVEVSARIAGIAAMDGGAPPPAPPKPDTDASPGPSY